MSEWAGQSCSEFRPSAFLVLLPLALLPFSAVARFLFHPFLLCPVIAVVRVWLIAVRNILIAFVGFGLDVGTDALLCVVGPILTMLGVPITTATGVTLLALRLRSPMHPPEAERDSTKTVAPDGAPVQRVRSERPVVSDRCARVSDCLTVPRGQAARRTRRSARGAARLPWYAISDVALSCGGLGRIEQARRPDRTDRRSLRSGHFARAADQDVLIGSDVVAFMRSIENLEVTFRQAKRCVRSR